jgi:hypothetical protein
MYYYNFLHFRARKKTWSRPLTLNEIIEELEEDDSVEIPDSIVILPPENCNADVTDEDSGDENQVNLNNLPGSQLRAPGEACFRSERDSSDDEDVPLIQFSKRRRVNSESALQQMPTREISIPKNKAYSWVEQDIHPKFEQWQSMQSPARNSNPLQYFELIFDEKVINIIVHYTNLYAAQNIYKNNGGEYDFLKFRRFVATGYLESYKKKVERKDTRTSQTVY